MNSYKYISNERARAKDVEHRLHKTESLGVFNSSEQLATHHLLVTGDLRQVEQVEASVRNGHGLGGRGLNDKLDRLHSVQWYPVAARQKQKKLLPLLQRQVGEHFPEHLDRLVTNPVGAAILGVLKVAIVNILYWVKNYCREHCKPRIFHLH
jgi:hypothetical protein